jgi:hypothetical protein
MIVAIVSAYKEKYIEGAVVPVGTVLAALGGIIAWCYKAGNARLGIVDLFACEIGTLCRICTIVNMVRNCIEAYGSEDRKDRPDELQKLATLRAAFSHFEAAERYTPVFDANAKELQVLSVKTLTNITAFYTYWKAVLDSFRRLSRISSPDTSVPVDTRAQSWEGAMIYLIYMQFLAFESARKAIRDLMEFEPNRTENTLVILLSELPAYGFLMKRFASSEDPHRARLELRREQFEIAIAREYCSTKQGLADVRRSRRGWKKALLPVNKNIAEMRRDWEKAKGLLPDLGRLYHEVFAKVLKIEAPALARVGKLGDERGCGDVKT